MTDDDNLTGPTLSYDRSVQGTERYIEEETLHFTEQGFQEAIDEVLEGRPTGPNERTMTQSHFRKYAKRVETTTTYPNRA